MVGKLTDSKSCWRSRSTSKSSCTIHALHIPTYAFQLNIVSYLAYHFDPVFCNETLICVTYDASNRVLYTFVTNTGYVKKAVQNNEYNSKCEAS